MGSILKSPDEEWTNYLAKMWLLGSEISKEILGQFMDGSLEDLTRLQAILDSEKIPAENTQVLQALGIVFGKVFVNSMPGYDWWILEDEHGLDPCVRYKETSLKIFPQTMISKRVEDGEAVDVMDLFELLKQDLRRILKENYPNA